MYKLVIIEDEHIIRKWLRYAVDYESLGIVVVGEAKDGKAGAALIRECQPHIVLTDINMPIMTAFEMFEDTGNRPMPKLSYQAMPIFLMHNQPFIMVFWNF